MNLKKLVQIDEIALPTQVVLGLVIGALLLITGILVSSGIKILFYSVPFILIGLGVSIKWPNHFFVVFVVMLTLTGFLDPLLSVRGGSLILPFVFSSFAGFLISDVLKNKNPVWFIPYSVWIFLILSLFSLIIGLSSYGMDLFRLNKIAIELPWGDIPMKNAIGWAVLSFLKLFAAVGIFILTANKLKPKNLDTVIYCLLGSLVISYLIGMAHYFEIFEFGSFHNEYRSSETKQYNSTFSHPNSLGVIAGLSLITYFGFLTRSKFPKWVIYMVVPISGLILLSGSRSSILISLIAVIFIFAFMLFANKYRYFPFVVVSLILAVWLGSLHKNPDTFRHIKYVKKIIQSKISVDVVKDVIEDRKVLWKSGWVTFQNKPILGVGRGLFHMKMPLYMPDRKEIVNDNSSNMYIQILAEQGLVGFITFMIVLISFGLSSLPKKAREIKYCQFVGLTTLVSMGVVFIFGAALEDIHVNLFFWFLMALPFLEKKGLLS